MHLGLKFATDIIRPWERLNQELVNQNSIDSDVSDFISEAVSLAIKLSHFAEAAGRKDIRTNKKLIAFNVIVDIADAAKHNDVVNTDRSNRLYISSLFEGTEEGMFRFIRNSIKVQHSKYGLFDFLQLAKEASSHIFTSLNLVIFWNPSILEAPFIFTDKVFLGIYFTHQITWSGLNIEFFKRDTLNELVHYDPPSWIFELRSPLAINTENYHDYIIELLKRSINNNSTVIFNPELKSSGFISYETFAIDALIKETTLSSEVRNSVQIVNSSLLNLNDIKQLQTAAKKNGIQNLILISREEFTKEIKEAVCTTLDNVYLISIDKLDGENIPLDFFKIKYQHTNIKLKAIQKFAMGVLKEDEALFEPMKGKPLSELGKNFSLDKINLISLIDFCLQHVKPKLGQTNGKTILNYKPRDKNTIYYKVNDAYVKIGIEMEFEWETEYLNVRMPILSFDKTHLGVSVWNLKSFIMIEGLLQELIVQVTKYGETSAVGMI